MASKASIFACALTALWALSSLSGSAAEEAECTPSDDCANIFDESVRCGLDVCEFARTCGDEDNAYLTFYACESTSGASKGFYLLLLVLWLLLLFALLGSTADEYFAPTLEQFSRDMGLPPRFAGVSLLALGNGAPDTSATISAVGKGGEGYLLSLGALTGAGMFVGTIVAGAVILRARGVSARGALVRDVSMYALSLVLVFAMFIHGVVTYYYATMLFVVYIVFVLVVLAADIYHRKVVLPKTHTERATRLFLELENFGADSLDGPETEEAELGRFGRVLESMSNYAGEDLDPSPAKTTGGTSGWTDDYMIIKGDARHHGDYDYVMDEDDEEEDVYMRMDADEGAHLCLVRKLVNHSLRWLPLQDFPAARTWKSPSTVWKTMATKSFLLVEEGILEMKALYSDFKDKAWHEKVVFILELPFTLFRKLSIPLAAEEVYSRVFLVLSVFLLPLWLCFYYDLYMIRVGASESSAGLPVPILMFLITGPIALIVAKTTSSQHTPHPKPYAAFVAAVGFVIAATWIDRLADNLVDVLQVFGLVCGVPPYVLGMTMLAWGNSIGDLITNTGMAKRGLANMAITACFAGPVFNMLIGLGAGFGLLMKSESTDEISVRLPPELICGLGFGILNCVVLIATGLACGGKVPTYYGYASVVLYVIYLVMVITLSFI